MLQQTAAAMLAPPDIRARGAAAASEAGRLPTSTFYSGGRAMSAWSFEVRDGRLDNLPPSLTAVTGEQRRLNAYCFFVAEAGVLLNEPEDKLIASVPKAANPAQVIARVGQAYSWFFDRLETEIDQHFQWNYLKLSFVNLNPLNISDTESFPISGKMTTNAPLLPDPAEQPPALMIHQLVTTLRTFFSHLRGSVEISDWESDLNACDWITMTFSRAS